MCNCVKRDQPWLNYYMQNMWVYAPEKCGIKEIFPKIFNYQNNTMLAITTGI